MRIPALVAIAIAIAIGITAMLALAGCAGGSPSTATQQKLTLSYSAAGAAITRSLTISGVDCTFASSADQYTDMGGKAKGNHTLLAQVGKGGTPVYAVVLKVSETLSYVSQEKFAATSDGLTFARLVGLVAITKNGDVVKAVDRKATLSGTLKCNSK